MTRAGPVAGFPHPVLGATSTDHGRGACGAGWGCPSRLPPGATRETSYRHVHAGVDIGIGL
jgi:hypothetical protein